MVKQIKKKRAKLDAVLAYKNLQPVRLCSLLDADDIVLTSTTKNKMQKIIKPMD